MPYTEERAAEQTSHELQQFLSVLRAAAAAYLTHHPAGAIHQPDKSNSFFRFLCGLLEDYDLFRGGLVPSQFLYALGGDPVATAGVCWLLQIYLLERGFSSDKVNFVLELRRSECAVVRSWVESLAL